MGLPLSIGSAPGSRGAVPSASLPETGLFLNRELSWLQFNRRVLHEALDPRTPLLERVGFLAIFSSNLDEFFQKRVGGLKRQIAAGVTTRTPDGLTPSQQLLAIREAVLPMLREQAEGFTQLIKPELAQRGVHLLEWGQLTAAQRQEADDYFQRNLFPVLIPLAVDPGHPFPFISNLSLSMGVMLRRPVRGDGRAKRREGEHPLLRGLHFARVKVPRVLPRWVRLTCEQRDEHCFIHMTQILQQHLGRLFEGMEIVEAQPFRVTRNADVERDEEDAEDLLELIEQELRERRLAQVIRLEVSGRADHPMSRYLMDELRLEPADVYEMPAELDYTDLWTIHALSLPEHQYRPWVPVTPPRLRDGEADIFSVIRAGDLLVHHPYESFGASVERFIRAAADDPQVIAIKLTLYRTSEDAPFIPQLIRAAQSGKQVVCLVELKARFDEQRNVQIAQRLEKAGVHVVYGIVGYKTHTKTALVVRQEAGAMRCYAHISTGNYNPSTAQLYTDLSLFTCDERITADLVELFHHLTGHSIQRRFAHLIVAPANIRERFTGLIDRQIERAAAWRERGGDPADPRRPRIIAKINSLEDQDICRKLYEASQAGVQIDLIVRGFCCLRPGVPGLSDHIRVMSVVGRFLEHSRIYAFLNGEHSEYYIGSADWMYRNLTSRVECVTPVYDPALQARLRQILDLMLADRRQAWDMQPDGSYVQRQPDPDDPATALGAQEKLMQLARGEGG